MNLKPLQEISDTEVPAGFSPAVFFYDFIHEFRTHVVRV